MASKSVSQIDELQKIQKRKDKSISVSETENIKYTTHSMNLMQFPSLNLRFCTSQEIEKRSIEYFNLCNQDNMKPTVAGYSLALGCSRLTLIDYLHGKKSIPTDNKEALDKFYGVLNALIEDYMHEGKINPVSGIFMMKNSFGYKDQQEIVAVDNRDNTSTPETLIAESNLMLSGDNKKADYESGE